MEVSREQTARQVFLNLKDTHAPQRKYIRRDLDKISDRLTRIQSVLLEYDQKTVLLSGLGRGGADDQTSSSSSSNRMKAAAQEQQQAAKNQSIEAQEENLKRLMNEMSETTTSDRGGSGGGGGGKTTKISANTIGQILGLQQSQLQQIATEFDQKTSELQLEMDQLEKLLASGGEGLRGLGGMQHQQRLINIMSKQIEQKEAALGEKRAELDAIQQKLDSLQKSTSDVNF